MHQVRPVESLVFVVVVVVLFVGAAAAAAPIPPNEAFIVALTYNPEANNNSIVQLELKTGAPAFSHYWGNLVFQYTASAFDPVNRTLILLGYRVIDIFHVDSPFPIARRFFLTFTPPNLQYDYVHRKLYAIKQVEHNEIVEINMETGEDTTVLRFNDTYATIMGSATFDPYGQRYLVGVVDLNNNNFILQLNVATGKVEQAIPVVNIYDQMFWNNKASVLLGLTNNTLVALELGSKKIAELTFIPGIPSLYGGAFDELNQQFYTVTIDYSQMLFNHVDLTANHIKCETLNIWNDFTSMYFVPPKKNTPAV